MDRRPHPHVRVHRAAELAAHYGTTIIPTRVRRPRDKAKVENAVLQVERWVQPLPAQRFEIPEWKVNVGVSIDYHVEFGRHYYSVPHPLYRRRVDIRATATIVEILQGPSRRLSSSQLPPRPSSRTAMASDPP